VKYLFILNDPPYGTERSYNGLRLARELLKDPAARNEIRLFLIGDAASCAKAGQKVPQGYYNAADMLGSVSRRGAEIGVCGSCLDARGIRGEELVAGSHRGSMDELAQWSAWADRIVSF
jgi:uncharacterized protein involved in oxidation of intracellular sulfur